MTEELAREIDKATCIYCEDGLVIQSDGCHITESGARVSCYSLRAALLPIIERAQSAVHDSYRPMKAVLKEFMSKTLSLQKRLNGVRDAIITDQATGAGDYSEAEEHADRIVGKAETNPMEDIADKSWVGLLLDEVEVKAAIERAVAAAEVAACREESRRQEYNRLNAEKGGTLGPMAPPVPNERGVGALNRAIERAVQAEREALIASIREHWPTASRFLEKHAAIRARSQGQRSPEAE
jgi:hypothetical protein